MGESLDPPPEEMGIESGDKGEKVTSPETLGAEYLDMAMEDQDHVLAEKGIDGDKFKDFMTGLAMVVSGLLGIGAGGLAYETAGKEPSQIIVTAVLSVAALGMVTISAIIGKELGLLQKKINKG